MTEEWRVIPSHPQYEVSNLGRVRHDSKVLKPVLGSNGYLHVTLPIRGRVLVHVLVLEAFVGPRPLNCVSRHKDGDKGNNTPSNLVWGTWKENNQDTIIHGKGGGRGPEMSEDRKAKYREVKRLVAEGLTATEAAKRVGLNRGTVYSLLQGRFGKGAGTQ